MFLVKKLSFTLNVGCAISSLELFCFGFRQITPASIVNCRRVSNFIDDGEKNMTEYVLYTRVPHMLECVYNATHPNAVIHKGAPRTHSSLSLALAQTH